MTDNHCNIHDPSNSLLTPMLNSYPCNNLVELISSTIIEYPKTSFVAAVALGGAVCCPHCPVAGGLVGWDACFYCGCFYCFD